MTGADNTSGARIRHARLTHHQPFLSTAAARLARFAGRKNARWRCGMSATYQHTNPKTNAIAGRLSGDLAAEPGTDAPFYFTFFRDFPADADNGFLATPVAGGEADDVARRCCS